MYMYDMLIYVHICIYLYIECTWYVYTYHLPGSLYCCGMILGGPGLATQVAAAGGARGIPRGALPFELTSCWLLPSIKVIPTVGPKADKQDLLRAIWSRRVLESEE